MARNPARRGAAHSALPIVVVVAVVAIAVVALVIGLSSPGGGSKAPVTQLAVDRGAVSEVAVKDFMATVTSSPIPVFVDFYATWCGPCKTSAPYVESLAERYDGRVLFLRVDVDRNPSLVSSFQVEGFPTFVMIKDGTIRGRIVGYADSMQRQFTDLIDASLG